MNPVPGVEPSGVQDVRWHLRWLLRLRWGALVAHLTMLALLSWLLDDVVALAGGSVLLGLNALLNGGLQLWRQQVAENPGQRAAAVLPAVLLLDIASLTVLLALTGGPMNPFTALYLVHVALGAVLGTRRTAAWVAAAAVAGYGALFWLEDPAAVHDHSRMVLHLRGMWIALSVAIIFVSLFVSQARQALAERDAAQALLQNSAARQARLAGLATLAGGAAHELATPLATIAVIAGELKRELGQSTAGRAPALAGAATLAATQRNAEPVSAPDDLQADVDEILREVLRCKRILSRLSVDGGAAQGEAPVSCSLRDIVDEAIAELTFDVTIAETAPHLAGSRLRPLPRHAVAQALRGLLQNAKLASDEVCLAIHHQPSAIEVQDRGSGMPPAVLARVGEPFFTTREPGAGMGLGVFLARTLAERFDGGLEIHSELGEGTRVRWRFAGENG